MKNYLLAGVGGQGTVLASRLLAQAAMEKGFFARTAETIGMAQRGGSVVSHVRIGEDASAPLIPLGQADVIIGFEPAEAVRALPYLREGGMIIASTKAIAPVSVSLFKECYSTERMVDCLKQFGKAAILVDGGALCATCGSSKVLNMALLGAAAGAGAIELTLWELEHHIRLKLPEVFQALNLKALELGYREGSQ